MRTQTKVTVQVIRIGVAVTWLAGCAACGGGSSGAPAPVAAVTTEAAGPTSDPREQAAQRFSELSKQLDQLDDGDALDPAWMRGQLQEILALDPEHPSARFNLAVLMEQAGEVAAADKVYAEIADDNDEFAPAAENVAASWVQRGDVERAESIYRRVIEADPRNVTSRLGLARILLSRKKYREAIRLCRRALQRQADAIEAFRVLAAAYHATGNIPMAQLIVARGLKIEEKDAELHYLLGQIFLKKGDLEAGVNKLKEVIRYRPDWFKVRAQLADIAMSYRDFGSAAQQYEAILKNSNGATQAGVKVALAVSYKGLGRYDQAASLYQEVLTQQPDNFEATWNTALLYHHHLNRFDEAIALYRQATTLAPNEKEYGAKAQTMIEDVQRQKSDLAALRAREERERRRQSALKAACSAVAKGRKAKADAIGNEQEIVEVAWQLMVDAQTLIQQGDVSGGEGKVKCAFGILPNTPQTNTSACAPMHVMWTQILYQLGRLDDALVDIRAALKCDPNNPDAQLIEQQLLELIAQQKGQGGGGSGP